MTEAVVVDPEKLGGGEVGSRFLFDADGTCVAGWPARVPPEGLGDRVTALDDRPKPAVRSGVAYLPTLPRVRLVIVGAGHVGQGVAKLAAEVDFDVWVVDDRQQYANAERFPTASRRIVGPIDEVLPALEMTPQTYALIVTRGHGHDQEALEHLAATPAGYVGLIGSRRKIKLIFESLREQGMAESALARVAAPVGLDIGSQTVPEIAISIVAELIARRNLGPRSPGSSRRTARRPMTPRPESRPGDDRRRRARRRAERADGEAQADPAAGGGTVIARVDRGPFARGGPSRSSSWPRRRTSPGRRSWPTRPRGPGRSSSSRTRRRPTCGPRSSWGSTGSRRGPAPSTVLLAPGDSPGITAELVRRIVARASAEPASIVVPRYRGRRGHPVALPWDLAAEVRDLPAGTGVNALLAARADRVVMLDVDDPGTTADLDTPDDYRAWVEAGRDGHERPNR